MFMTLQRYFTSSRTLKSSFFIDQKPEYAYFTSKMFLYRYKNLCQKHHLGSRSHYTYTYGFTPKTMHYDERNELQELREKNNAVCVYSVSSHAMLV